MLKFKLYKIIIFIILNMEYNIKRKKLSIPEYGRHIQQMIDFCKSIKEVKKRNLHAQYVINLMGNMNPHLRDIPDFQHKLWDQLYIMSDFDLDVDFPCKLIKKDEISKKPKRLNYPQERYSHKYYGKNIRKMIEQAAKWNNIQTKDLLLQSIGNQMKKSYINYNKSQIDDSIIFLHIEEISKGKIKAKELNFTLIPSFVMNFLSNNFSQKKNNKKKVIKRNSKKK